MSGIPTIHSYCLPTVGKLPSNTVTWQINPARAVLLIHDMQGYFISPLPHAMRDELVQKIAQVRRLCVAAGIPIAYTTQPGRMSKIERGLLLDFWGPGMQSTAADRHVVEELAPTTHDWIFTKWRYSAFFRTDLCERMNATRRDQLLVCGVYAHVGILVSIVDAFMRDIQPFLVADGVADFSEAHHHQALEFTAKRCGKVLTAEEIFL